uniref:Uncharacterized protein n=1 Tax=uncultured prokaryote TaxID=198431 RepID=H5S8Z7_9ZZZZ|nr:hypothetical protein HGMM_F01H12C05 [uncultured prokaryote]
MFSYSGNPGSSPKDEVRFWLQDTVPPGLLQDEEILFALTRAGGFVPLAVAYCMEALASRYAQEAISQTTGDISTNAQARADYWRERLQRWLEQHGLALYPELVPEMVGKTKDELEREFSDSSLVPRRFRFGFTDNRRRS